MQKSIHDSAAAATPTGYYSGVDGLRAVAVLAVVLYHLNARWLPGGFVGVDVFFVISGFVVSCSMANLRFTKFSQLLTHFYARRFMRIAPALVVCLLLVTLVSCMLIPKAWLSQANSRTGLAAFFGVSNFVMVAMSNDYFSPRAEFNPFTHTWSLAVEEQFYFVFPLLLFGWLGIAGAGRSRGRVASTLALLLLGIASLLLCAWWSARQPTYAFYLLPARFWELACGVALVFTYSWWHPRVQAIPLRTARLVGATLLLALGLGLMQAKVAAFPFPWAMLPVMATMGLLCLLVAQPDSWVARLLSAEPARHVGRISYSLYLWHWPVFVLFRWTVGLEAPQHQLAAVGLAWLLSELSTRFVEKPIRNSTAFGAMTKGRVVGLGSCALALGCGLSLLMFANQNHLSLSVTRDADLWSPASNIQLPASGADCQVNERPDTSAQSEGVVHLLVPSECKHGAPASHRIFVAGDSHTWAYTSMLRMYAQQSGTEIRLITRGGCPFFDLRKLNSAESAFCAFFTAKGLRVIEAQARSGDVLFLPSLRLARLSDQWGEIQTGTALASGLSADESRNAAAAEAIAALAPLAKRGVLIVFEAAKPIFKAAAFRCSDWFNSSNPACAHGLSMDRASLETMRRPVQVAMQSVVAQLPHAEVWDPLPVLCPETKCSTHSQGKPLFFDGDHVSGNGNAVLLPDFSTFMARITRQQQRVGEVTK
jgi:peptidoglycan/LPS O-acetylase OafA/YrhL